MCHKKKKNEPGQYVILNIMEVWDPGESSGLNQILHLTAYRLYWTDSLKMNSCKNLKQKLFIWAHR